MVDQVKVFEEKALVEITGWKKIRDKLLEKSLEPPYVPKSNENYAYFDKNLVKQNATEVADTMLTPAQQQIVKSDPN